MERLSERPCKGWERSNGKVGREAIERIGEMQLRFGKYWPWRGWVRSHVKVWRGNGEVGREAIER